MAKGYATDVQSALRTYLKSKTEITNLVGHRIVDEAPEGIVLPYIQFGRITYRPDDTDGTLGAIVTVGLEVHSRPEVGRIEAQNICEVLQDVLHRQPEILVLQDHTALEVEVLTFVVVRKPDGATYLGTLALDVHLDA